METHQPDPTSDDTKDPWDTVSTELSALGDRLRQTYRAVASEDGPTEDEIKGALSTLAGAWSQVAGSLSSALQDPATRAHLKKAAGSLAAALSTTISDLGKEMEGEEAAPAAEDPAAAD